MSTVSKSDGRFAELVRVWCCLSNVFVLESVTFYTRSEGVFFFIWNLLNLKKRVAWVGSWANSKHMRREEVVVYLATYQAE